LRTAGKLHSVNNPYLNKNQILSKESKETMIIEHITHGQWKKVYRCTCGKLSLVAIADVGPRILSLRYDQGPNILFEDTNNQYKRGDWQFYGGHRFWVGPETEHAFLPENQECEVLIDADTISLIQPKDPMGLQKILTICPGTNHTGFCIKHTVKNSGTLLYPGSIWTLTCVQSSQVVVPWLTGSEQWQCGMVRYWCRWENHTTNPADTIWKPQKDHFWVDPDGTEGKIGIYSEQGLLLWLGHEHTFIKTFKPISTAQYPDGGCNAEVYTCRDFIEMESLSPITVFHPGQSYTHIENWYMSSHTFLPGQWQEATKQVLNAQS
jgi:hypothetical protein